VLVPLGDAGVEARVLAEAAAAGIAIVGLRVEGFDGAGEGPAGVIVGYAAAQEHSWDAALVALLGALARAGLRG
jgi:hypothetical protein